MPLHQRLDIKRTLTREQHLACMEWAEALQSGKYKQGMGMLIQFDYEDRPSYCCLGVACQLAYPDLSVSDLVGYLESRLPRLGTIVVPEAVEKKFGIDEEVCEGLGGLNDSYTVSFLDLGKRIKEWADSVRTCTLLEGGD